MFRFSLRRLLTAFVGFAILSAFVGLLINQSRLVQVLFDSGDTRVLIESSATNPRGTFFELYRDDQLAIKKTEISHHPIKASEIQTHEFDPSGKLIAYHYHNSTPEIMNVLLLVDLEYDAYAIYWAGCRADKCGKLDWKTWDERSKNFARYLNGLTDR